MSTSNKTLAMPDRCTVLLGYLKKLKTMKKKYFVLYCDSVDKSARLEYYDSEKKFKTRYGYPKRCILIKNCFHINRRLDTKHKYVISLYTKDECFSIVYDVEMEMNKWLKELQALHRIEECEGDKPRTNFEHVWQVQVQRKGLAEEKGIIGNYHLCLTDKSLTLVRTGPPTTLSGEVRMPMIEFMLNTIRRCGDSQCYFYMEFGRHSAIGAGELWMGTEDPLIAQNMHKTIINAMSAIVRQRDEFGPITRNRSSSANEASKPILMLQRRQTHVGGAKPFNFSPSESTADVSSTVSSANTVITTVDIHNQSATSVEQQQSSSTNNSLSKNLPSKTNQSSSPKVRHQETGTPTVLSAASYCPPATLTTTSLTATRNPHYPSTAPLRLLGYLRRHSVSATSSVSHQRALSLPIATPLQTNLNAFNSANANSEITTVTAITTATTTTTKTTTTTSAPEYVMTQSLNNNSNNNNNNNNNSTMTTTSFTITPVHQRTRSLPLTEETAIQVTTFQSFPLPHNSTQCLCGSKNCSSGNSSKTNINQQQYYHQHHHHYPSHHHHHHPHTHHATLNQCCHQTTISHFYNRQNSGSSFDSNHSDHGGAIVSTTATLPLTTVANSMESIVEDQTLQCETQSTTLSDDDKIKSLKSKSFGIGSMHSAGHHFLSGSPLSMRRGGRGNATSTSRSTAMGRERCDSLPSRNRTTSETMHTNLQNTSMPPPRSIPSLSRPHSMYTQRHSHSPPVHTIPLSPSAGCSESDGSSLSIDETDGYTHSITPDEGSTFGSKYFSSRTSGLVIPEENPDDFWYAENNKRNMPFIDEMNTHGTLSLPIYQNQSGPPRKGSPGPPVYTEMYSPSGSSPGDHPMGSGYMIMSPGADFGRSMYTSSSGAHSRASSLAEEAVDGYVPIEPQQHQPEEYVDMESSNRHHTTSGMSSAASSCSITSGTPSTDMRFAEYQLDKVVSRFTPDDEDTSLLTERRPARAYSVGSRLEHNKRKLRVDLLAAEHNNARARAFSVGSRAKMPRSELYRGVIQTAHLSNIAQEAAANATNNNNNTTKSSKSLSAPLLINNKNPGSIDPMDDLMEIDYTSKNTLDNSSSTGTPIRMSKPVSVPVTKRYDGLSDMLPGREKLAGYVEMKPAMNAHEPFSMHSQYGYMEMKPVGSGPSIGYQSSPSSSPKKSITSPKTIPTKTLSNLSRNNNYMDMTPRSIRMDHQPVTVSPHGSSDDYLNMSPIGQNSEDKSMEVDLPKTLSAPEGYMEMSWGAKSSTSSSNTGIAGNNNLMEKPASDEYINMNFSRKDGQAKETRLSSLPIAIQLNKFNQNVHKNTIGNVPPSSMNLSALLKNSRPRCDSKDSGIVTPSGSHPSIFPFSPGSPNKQFSSQTPLDENNLPRKCLVDASTGTLRLSEDDASATTDNSNNSWSQQSVDLSSKILNTDVYMDMPSTPLVQPVDKLSNDYADMTIRSKKPKTPEQKMDVSDYVNCSPLTATLSKPITNKTNSIPSRDYEIMNPALSRKIPVAAPEPVAEIIPPVATPVTMKKFALVTINSNSDKLLASTKPNLVGFKPISILDEQLMKSNTKDSSSSSSSWRPRYTSAFSRQLSEKGSASQDQQQQQQGDSSPYELLQMRTESSIPFQGRVLSRPNSVNSEKISSSSSSAGLTNLTRPNSANSDRLPTISTSSSSSTLCGSSSSSQTLCGSKCQSPLTTTTRPQSFSEIEPRSESGASHITSRPPSVSSERELHYASLDLPPPSSEKPATKLENTDVTTATTTSLIAASSSSTKTASPATGDSSSSSPSPNAGTATDTQTDQPTFTYAQIDFIRSESMNVAQAGNASNSGMIAPQSTATTNQLHSPQKYNLTIIVESENEHEYTPDDEEDSDSTIE